MLKLENGDESIVSTKLKEDLLKELNIKPAHLANLNLRHGRNMTNSFFSKSFSFGRIAH